MTKIQILGSGCAKCRQLTAIAEQAAQDLGLQYELEKVTDVNRYAEFGVMFTPDQQRAASEMARVCRPGGKIGLANWTPESFIGQLFKAIGKHIPPPPGLRPPALWGTEVRLAELFGESAASIDLQRRNFVFRYRSPAHWLEVFRTYYGPTKRAFEALDAQGGKELEKEILALLNKGNRSGDGTLVLPSEYAQVVIVRA